MSGEGFDYRSRGGFKGSKATINQGSAIALGPLSKPTGFEKSEAAMGWIRTADKKGPSSPRVISSYNQKLAKGFQAEHPEVRVGE